MFFATLPEGSARENPLPLTNPPARFKKIDALKKEFNVLTKNIAQSQDAEERKTLKKQLYEVARQIGELCLDQ